MCLYFLNELKMHRQPDVLCYVHSALTSCWNNFLWFNILGTPSSKKVCLGNCFHVKPNYSFNVSSAVTAAQCCGSASNLRRNVDTWTPGCSHLSIISLAVTLHVNTGLPVLRWCVDSNRNPIPVTTEGDSKLTDTFLVRLWNHSFNTESITKNVDRCLEICKLSFKWYFIIRRTRSLQ